MILLWFIVILLAGGVGAWIAARWSANAARWVALAAVSLDFVLAIQLWISSLGQFDLFRRAVWIRELDVPWVPQLGIHFHLAMDGLSLLMVVLTMFLGILSVLASWREITEGVGFFHWNLMWILAGITSVFVAIDLFLFYFAWELMLIPMYFLIAIWGHGNRTYAALKFFLFTQISGLLMLVSILALAFLHQRATGVFSFQYETLLGTGIAPSTALWIMLGFFVAFAVKMPVFPFHPWLPDAHTEAPTAGSVILAGLMLKTGAYGLIRFVMPLFPDAARQFAPVALALGVVGILYGALLAFGQTDLKRLVAYTSVSHLGFVLVGIFSWNELALQGAVVTMIAHGVSTGGLFVLVGALQERIHTREMARMGGLWATIPRLSGAAMVFALASLGLPGLADFVGEVLVLLGAWENHRLVAVLATVGILAATLYALRFIQRAFHGPNIHQWQLPDLHFREAAVVGSMIAVLLWLGLYPRPVLDTFAPTSERLRQTNMYVRR
ncbi:MAG TPA: NADH-quinone oxidoreductase subunit M [Bryobacteraceae bacterium]|nr:NADH-quinone oxidoreductase subunit M [Bryobacteraceae bacterium]